MNRRQFLAGLMATAAAPKLNYETPIFREYFSEHPTWQDKRWGEICADIRGLVDQMVKVDVTPSSVVMSQEAFDELTRLTPMVLERTSGVFTVGNTVVRVRSTVDADTGSDGEDAREETEADV